MNKIIGSRAKRGKNAGFKDPHYWSKGEKRDKCFYLLRGEKGRKGEKRDKCFYLGNNIADGTRTSKRSHYASLGFAAFIAKRRKSPGLDLRNV